MASLDDELAALRKEIDAIDTELHDLLMRRTELAVRVGEVKAQKQPVGPSVAEGAKFIRPAREAAILRRLIARHRGKLPKAVVVRMWREMISALLQVEGPFAVAVYAPGDHPGFWDLARDHYGTRVTIFARDTVEQVVHAVREGEATVGIIPLPEEGELTPWWPAMLQEKNGLHVMGHLPFADCGNQRGGPLEGLVIGYAPDEPSGRDRTLLAVTGKRSVTRSQLQQALRERGQPPIRILERPAEPGIGIGLFLVELDGFWTADDPELQTWFDGLADGQRVIGHYAVPFSAEELHSENGDA